VSGSDGEDFDAVLARLAADRAAAKGGRRLMASICGQFPIYSQTFVYQELIQLLRAGYEVRHAYSYELPRADLHDAFAELWPRRCRLAMEWDRNVADFAHYRARFPDRVASLVAAIATATGKSPAEVEGHYDFVRGFSYARMVEAWQPHWLHSYFFYERSFYSLIAGWVLQLPTGVSCYADHVLADYDFKVVPLHLRTCRVVVATSARIKQELLQLAPDVDPDKILVKPNAVDSAHFPFVERPAPASGAPWRLVCVARLEPKKGHVHLVEAVAMLRGEFGLPVELTLVGEADAGNAASEDYARQVRERVAALGLGGAVHFAGRQPQAAVRRFLADSHAWVAPFVETAAGDKDGIPTALLEAMATGAPVVVTDAGSMLEVVTDGKDGLVVAQRDAKALATAIRRLVADGALRAALGRAAARVVAESFDVKVCEARLHRRMDVALGSPPS
jgi:colanic acid/amylovoran biosynthesis glycosyltransferase